MIPYEETRRKECTSLLFKRNCTAPAKITLTPEHIRINEVISRKQTQNRERHDKIVEDLLLAMNVDAFAQAIEEFGVCIGAILVAPMESRVTQIGVQVFYHLVENLDEVTMKFQATHDLYFQVLEKLGVSTR